MLKSARHAIRSTPASRRSSTQRVASRNSANATDKRAPPLRPPKATPQRREKAASAAFFVAELSASRHPHAMRAPRPYVSEPIDPTEVSPSGEYRAYKAAGLL